MRRPTVVHVARDWVRPSERFVSDLVATTTATRAVVACGRHHPGTSDAGVPVREIGRWADIHSGRARDRRVLRGALAAVAVTERAALLHAHFGYWAAHTARVAGRLGRPWVLSWHGHDLLVEDPVAAEREVLRTAALVAVPSAFLADAASRAGFPDERIRVLPSGVDLARLPFRERTAPADRGVRVTFAGRFVAKKGVLDAVEGLRRAAADLPALEAVFVGTGPLLPDLREALARSGLAAEIRDGSEPGAVPAALERTDLLVMPSRTAADGDAESLGLVAVEAQACGVPVIATRHGGLTEAVSAAAGRFVTEADPEALARAVVELAQRPGEWAAMGRAGRRHVRARFELGARTATLEAAYLALVGRRPVPGDQAGGLPGSRPPAATSGPGPHVTVVMVTHDRRELCRRGVAAIRAQTYAPLDLVVVDNASSDGTAADLRRVADEDDRVRVVTAAAHLPPAAARNRAVAASDGDVVAFTDDDCFPTSTWVEALVAGLDAGTAPGIVQGRTIPDPDGWLRPLSRTQWTPAEYGLYETANIAYRREVLGEAPFDEGFARRVADVLGPRIGRYPFGEDTELAWRVKRTGAPSAFSATAVVQHHVYDPDVRYLLRRAVIAAGFPLVVREVPELRERFLWQRVFLGPGHAATLAAVAGAASLRRRPAVGAALVVPYAVRLVRPLRPGRRQRLRAAPLLVVRDLVELAAVGYGAARARTPLI